MSARLTFPAVTPAQYHALQDAAAQAGLTMAGTDGSVSTHGCTVAYHYAGWDGGGPQPLTLTLLHAPFLCGGLALHQLHDLVEQVLSAPASPAEKSTP